MSREIKFRGASKETGKLVYGNLIQSSQFKDGRRDCWIQPKTLLALGALSTPTERFISVAIDSVGQFTGAFDTSCKEMYTGDKVRVDGLGTCTVALCPYYGVVFVDSTGDEHAMIGCMDKDYSFKLIEGSQSND